ncbi:hypothetical protein G7Y89_g8703 [Cudoniella acicularis]|uniref:Uncharacterized protein n=1 Tax=Cudoniella acicularis TaxID=354080 RepID=A0A8H4W2M4_9HELO|nr:hypothetical protein G7Y89_g8703 [Cudoniella acicularis]
MTMIDVGGLRHGIRLGQIHRVWNHGSLREFILSIFSQTKELPNEVKLEKLFNARNLQRFASIQIIWTNNLADHLQLEDDDTIMRIFSHASFLELHRICNIFPPRFIDETLRTLALLLPSNDKKTVA